jgi:predicted nuclease of predicted toxin-antitoxin system
LSSISRRLNDEVIWRHAEHTRATIISKDEDFAVRRTMNATGPIVVWIRLGNSTKPELLRWFSPLFAEILVAIEAGEALIEVINGIAANCAQLGSRHGMLADIR